MSIVTPDSLDSKRGADIVGAAKHSAFESPSILSQLQSRVAAAIGVIVASTLILIGVIGYRQATEERKELTLHLAERAHTVAHLIDREATVAASLLTGLSRSPALRHDRLSEFHEQLVTTPVGKGAWFVLADEHGQIINSRFPFGTTLPSIRNKVLVEQVRRNRFFMSNLIEGTTVNFNVIVALLRIDNDSGEMKHILITIIPAERFSGMLDLPPGTAHEFRSIGRIIDRNGTIVSDRRESGPPRRLNADILRALRDATALQGAFAVQHTDHGPVHVSYARSTDTGYIAVIETPLAIVDGGVRRWAVLTLASGACLVMIGGAGWYFAGSRMRQPIEALNGALARSREECRQATVRDEWRKLLFERVSTACPDLIYMFDVRTQHVEYFNSQARELFGSRLGYGGLSGRFDEIWHPSDRAAIAAHLAALRNLGDDALGSINGRIVDAQGRLRWFKTRDMVFSRDREGRVQRIIGVAADITDVKAAQEEVTSAHDRMRSILDSVTDCYFTADADLRITDANDAAAAWAGRPRADMIGHEVCEVFNKTSESDRAIIRSIIGRTEPVHVEMACTIQPGRWCDVHFYPSDTGFSCFFRDITDRKIAHEAMDKSRELLASTLDAMPAQIAILDEAGHILVVNEAWKMFLRRRGIYLDDDGVGENYLDCDPVRPPRRDLAEYRAGLRAVLNGTRTEFLFSYRVKMDSEHRWFRVHAARFHSDGWARIVVACDDITALESARLEIDSLASRLVNLQEKERQRYAGELHDSTVQHLTAINLNLMVLRKKVKIDNGAQKTVDDIEYSLEEAQREIRSVSYLLYPRNLDHDGLASTLRRFAEGFERRTRIAVKLRLSEDIDDLSIALQRSVLRIIQEALTNVHRHARATTVAIEAAVRRGVLTVSVLDNGGGFGHAARPADSTGVGVPGMKARVRHFGGVLKIRTGRKGTRVFARIPLHRGNAAGGRSGRQAGRERAAAAAMTLAAK